MNRRIGLTLACAGISIAAALPLSPAKAQNPMPVGLPHMPAFQGVVAGEGDQSYLVQHPQLILGDDIRSVLFSPDARFLLAAREVRTATAASLLGDPRDAPGEITISLWRPRTRRTGILWRHALEPGHIGLISLRGWMGTKGTALVSVLLRPGIKKSSSDSATKGTDSTYTVLLFLLDTASGTVREIVLPPKMDGEPLVSPTLPTAALMGSDGWAQTQIIFLRPDGTLSPPLPLPVTMFTQGWSADGKVLQAAHKRGGAGPEPDSDWYGIDPVSMTVSRLPAPRKTDGDGKIDPKPRDLVQANLPLKLVLQTPENGSSDGQGEVWLKAGENPGNSVRLTLAGYPIGILPDLSGAVYRASGGLYFVPLLSVPKDRLPRAATPGQAQGK